MARAGSDNSGAKTVERWLKRALDIGLSGIGLAVTVPIQSAISGAILLSMGRPVFFRQQRPGLGGKPFWLCKFRTMRETRPGEEPLASDGQRLTRVGAFLRAASLDELPTLWNVLLGDMSLVGPRPLLMQYLDRYTPQQARRHEVPPGVTGWAQINGRNAIGWEKKFEMDVWYVENASLALDLKILLLTVWKVLHREGISASGAATMPEFMGMSEGEGNR